MNISDIRKEYTKEALDAKQVKANPIDQFNFWFEEAVSAQVPEVNAMTLSTVSALGRPSGRIVLLKGVENSGFVFYTNYNSQKGKELLENPFASLTFHWISLERQIRIEGKVEKVDSNTSDTYFQSRPRGSQIGAHVSPQSQEISSREILIREEKEITQKFDNITVPRPTHWGGYILMPDRVEFWQGRPSRLHDRIVYALEDNQTWKIKRLAP